VWTDCERLPLTAGCEGPQRPDLPRGAARLRRPQHYLARSARGIRDLDGRPLAFHLTEGQASDSPQFEVLLDLGPDITPRAAVGDKGYDGQSNRTAARERGICPVIPFKLSARNRPAFFPKALYRARARIEQLVGKLKRFKRIALRWEKTNKNFGSFVAFALAFIIGKIRPQGLSRLHLTIPQMVCSCPPFDLGRVRRHPWGGLCKLA
jgi:transposase